MQLSNNNDILMQVMFLFYSNYIIILWGQNLPHALSCIVFFPPDEELTRSFILVEFQTKQQTSLGGSLSMNEEQ